MKRLMLIAVVLLSVVGVVNSAPTERGHFGHLTEIQMPTVIEDVSQFTDAVRVLRAAEVGDVCKFKIAGRGGVVEVGEYLIREMHHSKCYNIMYLVGPVYSMHSMVAVAGDRLDGRPGTFLMFHQPRFIVNGRPTPMPPWEVSAAKVHDADALKGLLTKEELDYIYNDMDNAVYINVEVMRFRMHIAQIPTKKTPYGV